MIKYSIQIFGQEFDSLDEAKTALETPNESYAANGHRDSDGRNYIFAYNAENAAKAQIYPDGSAILILAGGKIKEVPEYSEGLISGAKEQIAEKPKKRAK